MVERAGRAPLLNPLGGAHEDLWRVTPQHAENEGVGMRFIWPERHTPQLLLLSSVGVNHSALLQPLAAERRRTVRGVQVARSLQIIAQAA